MKPFAHVFLVPVLCGFLMITSGCVPTVSLHTFRNVAITITAAETGKPVASMPFEVEYYYAPADSPIAYHIEFRTPRNVKAMTDERGKAVVRMADYAWGRFLEIDAKERGYYAIFDLPKKAIRKGGNLESRSGYGNYPQLLLSLRPITRHEVTATGH